MMRNFKFLGAMLVFLVSLESCKGCAVGADTGCPAGQIDIDDKKTCKAVVAVANTVDLVAEIKKATAGGKWTANLNYIDTSKVTDMEALFADKALTTGKGNDLEKFNGRIDKWNTSKVTNMTSMFTGAAAFNQPIGTWNVSNVTTMDAMFSGASVFNQPIGNWNVSNVTNMDIMFSGAVAFNQDIGNWNVSKVTDMTFMFSGVNSFDQNLSKWTPNINSRSNVLLTFDGTAMFIANKLPTFAPWYCTISGAGTGAGGGCP